MNLAIAAVAGFVIGFMFNKIIAWRNYVGVIEVDSHDENRVRYSLEVTRIPLEDLPKHKHVTFDVRPYKATKRNRGGE